ncbi:MAG TPA: SDR family oxidoreductase [Asanoa sp.]|jgi:NAD(P)-dependent dehydrogenase (short-subunit alcohol dehydrogenase family)|nr:SDR family oxidoreductase [Asanoa sp.]
MLLQDRLIAVTGGANGIGAAVVRRCAQLGARGVVLDLATSLKGDLPEGWHEVALDVRDEASVNVALNDARRLLGGLDGVVAAAGVVPSWQPAAELDLDDFDRVLSINARGVAAIVKHAAPLLGPGATITVVASLNSWRGDPNIISYAASKHAALGIVRSAALALGPAGVRVNAVAPGPIATDALRGRMASRAAHTGLDVDAALQAAAAGTALRRIATAGEVADAIVFLTSGLSSGITGQLLNVDGGIL